MKSEKRSYIYIMRNSKASPNMFNLLQGVKTKTTIATRKYFFEPNIARDYQMPVDPCIRLTTIM